MSRSSSAEAPFLDNPAVSAGLCACADHKTDARGGHASVFFVFALAKMFRSENVFGESSMFFKMFFFYIPPQARFFWFYVSFVKIFF